MKKSMFSIALCSLLATAAMSGCGGVDTRIIQKDTISLGQQLIDLKKAHDEGAINDSEFVELKQQLILSGEKKKRK